MKPTLIDNLELSSKIEELLNVYYTKRIQKLDDLDLKGPLKRKNPYLYKTNGVQDASKIVEELLLAHVSSSDETIFGNEFFEPLAIWVAGEATKKRGGSVQPGSGEGIDITVEYDQIFEAIAVKSGVNVFNAASKKKQKENFESVGRRLAKLKKQYVPLVGYCYGNKVQSLRSSPGFEELAGQAFWEHISGESDFFLRIINLIESQPLKHVPVFDSSFNAAKNKLVKQFLDEFSNDDGSIDWDRLVQYNSGIKPVKVKKAKE